MSTGEKTFWFPAKKYGWGWGFPITWQGWVVFIVYFALFLAGVYKANFTTTFPNMQFTLYIIVITAVLLVICWLKGEYPFQLQTKKLHGVDVGTIGPFNEFTEGSRTPDSSCSRAY